jgi:predicted Fe-S protein YdhL (DUF1289 family)
MRTCQGCLRERKEIQSHKVIVPLCLIREKIIGVLREKDGDEDCGTIDLQQSARNK